MNGDIDFTTDVHPSPDELLAFYERQAHPNHPSRDHVARMIESSYCFVTARKDGRLIGFCRGVTDGLVGWLAECKLDPTFQGPGAVTRKDGRIEHDSAGIAAQMAGHVLDALWAYGVERIDASAYGTEVDFCEELGFRKRAGVVAMGLDRSCRADVRTSSDQASA